MNEGSLNFLLPESAFLAALCRFNFNYMANFRLSQSGRGRSAAVPAGQPQRVESSEAPGLNCALRLICDTAVSGSFPNARAQIFFQTGGGGFKGVVVLPVGEIGEVIFADFFRQTSAGRRVQ